LLNPNFQIAGKKTQKRINGSLFLQIPLKVRVFSILGFNWGGERFKVWGVGF